MGKPSDRKLLQPLNDDDLLDINGGIGRSDVSCEAAGCGWFYAAAGTQTEQKCVNCFYFHPEEGKTYCSHPRFGR